jgi:hypothetical protein
LFSKNIKDLMVCAICFGFFFPLVQSEADALVLTSVTTGCDRSAFNQKIHRLKVWQVVTTAEEVEEKTHELEEVEGFTV